jgi:hypothetical protein
MTAVQRYFLPDPPFTHRGWLGIREKERLGMDHMGTEMLVPDRPLHPVDSRFRGCPSDGGPSTGDLSDLGSHYFTRNGCQR